MRGGCWALFRSESWLRGWLTKRKLEWMLEEEFKIWIGEMEFEGELTNGVRIILEAWRDKVHI